MVAGSQMLDVPRKKAMLVSELLSSFRDDIRNGNWKPGQQLPTERELESSMGVSRSAVRKYLKELEQDGLITRHVGRGTFVAAAAAKSLDCAEPINRILGAGPSEVIEVRLRIEPWAAGLAATRASLSDLDLIRKYALKAEAAIDLPGFGDYDEQFHAAIVEAARNELLTGLYQIVNQVRHQEAWKKINSRVIIPKNREVYHKNHQDLVDALCDRDPVRAQEVSLEHLLVVKAHLLGE